MLSKPFPLSRLIGHESIREKADRLNVVSPLLTIAIPTWNRAAYLALNLAQLHSELAKVDRALVEVVVSDNCSPDHTKDVVEDAVKAGLAVHYVRNAKNLGWAENFAQCFTFARGKYVLLLGDDDLLVDGALARLIYHLSEAEYGVVCLRPYGYDVDYRREYPGGTGRDRTFSDPNLFLITISRYFTLTSALVLNKTLLSDVDVRQFIHTDLATFHLMLRAALAANANLYIERFLIASKRQNSSSYEYSRVFVGQFWEIVDAHIVHGLSPGTVRRLERRKLLTYYAFYLFNLRRKRSGDLKVTLDHFAARFGDSWLFAFWLAPIIRWPRPLALFWGAITTLIGRTIGGDFRRGIMFAWNQMIRPRCFPWDSRAVPERATSHALQSSVE